MMRRWLLLGTLGLLALGVVVVATFPAAVAWRWWGERVPELRLQGVTGSVWSGAAQRLAVRGQALGALRWQLSPWALLGGAVQAQIELDGPGLKLRSAVRATRDGQVQLSDLGADAEAGWLAPALAIPALEPTGTLSVNGASLTLDRTHLPRAVDATLYWNQAGVRGQAVARLGSLTLTAQGQDGHIQLNIHDAGDGELEVRGSATLDGARYRSEVVLVPRVAEGPVVQALQWVGEARPEGGRLLIVEGQIVLPQETL